MENKSHALVAGLFTILLGIGLALAALWLGRDRSVRNEYELVTSHGVSGLVAEAPVRFRGVDVGKVDSIRLDPAHPGQILVRVGIIEGAPVTRSTFGELAYQGVTGLTFVQLDDHGNDTRPLTTSPDHVAQIPLEPNLLDRLTGNSQALLASMDNALKSVNDLLSPQNQRVLINTLEGLNEATAKVTEVGAELRPALEKLPATIDDTQKLLAELQVTVASYRRLADGLQGRDGTLARVSTSLDAVTAAVGSVGNDTLPRLNTLSDDAARSVRSLSRAADDLEAEPQSILFGKSAAAPGPGEPGFAFPAKGQTR